MTDFEDLGIPGDTTGVGTMLDNIDGYSTTVIYNAVMNASDDVLLAYFGSYPDARDVLTARLDTLLGTGGTVLDSDLVQQYCMVLLPLLNDINDANHVNGVAVEAADLAPQQQQLLDQAEDNFRTYVNDNIEAYNSILVNQENAEWGLADYLLHTLDTGGCNNVFASWAILVVTPYAEHGFVRLEEQIRDHLMTRVGIPV
ncbi:hypothetical protein [Actinophytocola oryzae]|uniref:Uncharacterized protein n=1 Tax=Actinophytocola oryzae TaxID=502181 RepID=A0A4R7W1Q9_9PSEU|nr:hypothetical protein [Actinophytocola oryzae]TDV56496.1 hypothetical protein CLV71_102563 [Actinophytocola oryzae]